MNRKNRLKDGISYERKGEHLEVRLVDNYRVIETTQFRLNDSKDNHRFFEYCCDKLGFDFKKYKRNKNLEYQ